MSELRTEDEIRAQLSAIVALKNHHLNVGTPENLALAAGLASYEEALKWVLLEEV